MKSPRPFDWKLFSILLVAGLTGVAASLPMALELVDRFVPEAEQQEIEAELPLPTPLLILLAIIQNSVIFGGAIAAGMALAPRVGTGAPLITAWLHGQSAPDMRRSLLPPLMVGLVLGTVLAMIDGFAFLPHAPEGIRDFGRDVPLWKRLLAGFLYGGITEELLMRWFLLSLLVWLLAKVWRTDEGLPTSGAWWTGNIVVAVLFGLGHLPATQALAPLTPLLVVRALVLNGAASLTFGYLFWRRGLEAAMVAHASAHIGLQLLGPTLGAMTAGD